MTTKQFAMLVADMRNAQREHSRTQSASALKMQQSLERRVDQELRELLGGQPRLFDEGEGDRA